MTNLILPPVDFAATIAKILEDYLPEDSLVHNLTDKQVSDMYSDLVAAKRHTKRHQIRQKTLLLGFICKVKASIGV